MSFFDDSFTYHGYHPEQWFWSGGMTGMPPASKAIIVGSRIIWLRFGPNNRDDPLMIEAYAKDYAGGGTLAPLVASLEVGHGYRNRDWTREYGHNLTIIGPDVNGDYYLWAFLVTIGFYHSTVTDNVKVYKFNPTVGGESFTEMATFTATSDHVPTSRLDTSDSAAWANNYNTVWEANGTHKVLAYFFEPGYTDRGYTFYVYSWDGASTISQNIIASGIRSPASRHSLVNCPDYTTGKHLYIHTSFQSSDSANAPSDIVELDLTEETVTTKHTFYSYKFVRSNVIKDGEGNYIMAGSSWTSTSLYFLRNWIMRWNPNTSTFTWLHSVSSEYTGLGVVMPWLRAPAEMYGENVFYCVIRGYWPDIAASKLRLFKWDGTNVTYEDLNSVAGRSNRHAPDTVVIENDGWKQWYHSGSSLYSIDFPVIIDTPILTVSQPEGQAKINASWTYDV